MRQDYIHDMNDPGSRAEYITADSADYWVPKKTRSFEHSSEVTTAWAALADTVRSDGSGTTLNGADQAVAAHLNGTVPELSKDWDSYITVRAHELVFGPVWDANEIADMVARDFLPDAALQAALDTARMTPETLAAIRTNARAYDDEYREAAALDDEHYVDEPELVKQEHYVSTATYKRANDTYPAHVVVEILVDRDRVSAEAAHAALSGEDAAQVEWSVADVATRHLQELAPTTARIVDDGYAITITMDLPAAPEANTTRTGDGEEYPLLTSWQEALLPALADTMELVLPIQERHQAQALALLMAEEIPPASDIAEAYSRVAVAEVIEHHERRMESYAQASVPGSETAALPVPTTAAAEVPGTITWEPQPGTPGRLVIDVPVQAPTPRAHLFNAVSALRPDDLPALEFDVDSVATRHLCTATGAGAHITNRGQRIEASIYPPTPLSQRPPIYGETPLYLEATKLRTLTAAQEAMLPDVATTVRTVVPTALHPHADDLARLVVQEIPAQADLLRAYQRTSLPEVLAEHDRGGIEAKLAAELQRLTKTTRLSFPHPASEALTTATAVSPATPARAAASGSRTDHSYDR